MSAATKSYLVYVIGCLLAGYLMDHYDPPHTAANVVVFVLTIMVWAVMTLLAWRSQLDRAARPTS